MKRLPEVTDPPSAWAALAELAKERSGLLAFDVGANTGQAAEVLAPHFAQVLSYEPCPDSYEVLSHQCPANVRPLPVALSRRPGPLELAEVSESVQTGQLVTWPASPGHPEWGGFVSYVTVPASTVDLEVGRGGVLPGLVKIDTEGHEGEVLAGAVHTIALGYTSWFVEVHDQDLGVQVRAGFGVRKYALSVIEHDLLADERGEDHYWVVARPR